MKVFGYICLILAILIAVTVFSTVLKMCTAPIESAGNIVSKTVDVDNVIYNYEWFKNQYEAYGAITTKINKAEQDFKDFNTQAGPRKEWTFEDKGESARLGSIASGLKYQRADLVAEYNARSKMVNRSIFKSGVPYSLPTD